MPRISNNPVLLNECKTLTIGYLLKQGYLCINSYKSGQVAWHKEGCSRCEGIINIVVKMENVSGMIKLEYLTQGEYVSYNIGIVSKPSNIGKGKVYYFLCPFTRLKCKNLYFIEGLFVHRSYFKNCLYATQTYSYNVKQTKRCIDLIRNYNLIQDSKEKPYFKSTYKGKITKAMLKILLKKERLHRSFNAEFYDWLESITQDKKETFALVK